MNVLLDTHFVIWYAKGDARFPAGLLDELQSESTKAFVSETSLLEVAIKHAKNPAALGYSADAIVAICEECGFGLRPITRASILAYGSLDFEKVGDLHRDPFDRLLIAHAKSEGLTLATHDRILSLYGEPCVKVYV